MPVENVKGFNLATCHHIDLVNLYGCDIGEGTKIGAFVEIGAGVKVGELCKIQSFAFIPNGVTIGNQVFIGPHVCFTNVKRPDPCHAAERYATTTVGNRVVIGAGSTILTGLSIGDGAFIGAGSVVTKDVPAGETWAGNPAKRM